jgi:hypothetical protein
MAVGDTITASRYNLIQGRINTILGTGSGQDGYGQGLTSSSVSVGAVITASDMNDLYTDIAAAHIHQQGSAPTTIATITVGNIIAESTSDNPNGTIKGYADYEAAMSTVESNKFSIAAGQSTATASVVNSTLAGPWNGTKTHEVLITFANANARRHFFNSGGEIRWSSSISGGSGAKTTDWSTMLSNMGTIKMNYTGTSATGTGTGSAIGNYDLTTSYQEIFTKAGSGIYEENRYRVYAKAPSTSTIQVLAQFEDNDPTADDIDTPGYPPTDENVLGTLTSNVGELRATGSYVSITQPTYANTSTL